MIKEQAFHFENRNDLRKWLKANHHVSKGIWMIFEKGRNAKTIKAQEALEEALCFGWIDGQLKRIDEATYQKKFTPRRKASHWSEKNKQTAKKLITSGRMTDAGIQAIENAKKNGSWDSAKSNPLPEDQTAVLEKALIDKKLAYANFKKMSPSIRKTYTGFYLSAKKEETRVSRLARIIERLEKNLKPM
jgi:uncharacterized protein YdeI (YjbR/CyaY-like superfamily)